MKRLLAGLLSLSMLSMPMLQVSAVKYNEDGKMIGRIYTVVGSFFIYGNGKTYEYCYLNNGCVISPNMVSDDITLEYGDVVWMIANDIAASIPGSFGTIEETEYFGKAEEYYGTTKELTITNIDGNRLYLEDEQNMPYFFRLEISEESSSYKSKFYVDDFHVGDKAIFVMNDDEVVLPLEFMYKAEVDESINLNPVETKVIAGDANGDSEIDIIDVIAMNKVILGQKQFTAEQIKACDFNQNGIVDPDDSLLLMKYIVGLIDILN
ncbi:MAG: hypothetical protein HDT22_01425 [Ruminococcus sp.]|nr:hypothetical protein [Ruminococcus sp.]